MDPDTAQPTDLDSFLRAARTGSLPWLQPSGCDTSGGRAAAGQLFESNWRNSPPQFANVFSGLFTATAP